MDNKDRNWREQYVLMIDNATTHSTKLAQATLARFAVPTLYTAPGSYLCSPIERLFRFIKMTDFG